MGWLVLTQRQFYFWRLRIIGKSHQNINVWNYPHWFSRSQSEWCWLFKMMLILIIFHEVLKAVAQAPLYPFITCCLDLDATTIFAWMMHTLWKAFLLEQVTVSDLSRTYSETLLQLVTIHCKWTLTEVFLWEHIRRNKWILQGTVWHSSIILTGQMQCADDSRGKERLIEDWSICFIYFPLIFLWWEKVFVLPCFSFLSVWTTKISNVIFTFPCSRIFLSSLDLKFTLKFNIL